MKTVQLLGELGKKFGKNFKLDVKNPAEAVRALCMNFPEFQKHLIDSEEKGVGYKVIVGKESQKIDDLHNPVGKQTIKFVPVLMGSKSRFTGIIIGAALIVASFYMPGMGTVLYGSGAGAVTLGAVTFSTGLAMVIGGTIQLLTPVPKTDTTERPDNKPSYVFNGAVNTTAQGYPVPVGYGRMIVGSAVISAGLVSEELPI